MKVATIPLGKERLDAPVSLYRGARAVNNFIKYTTIGEVFDWITNEDNQKLVNFTTGLQELKQTDPDAYKKEKVDKCPAFIIGRFPKRKNEACELYVPLLAFDIDELECEEVLGFYLEDLVKDPFVFAAFPSPSRLGLRVLMWCEAKPETHKAYYQAGCKHLAELLDIPLKEDRETGPFVDTSTNNTARLWFYTHIRQSEFVLNLDSAVLEIPTAQPEETIQKSALPLNGRSYKVTFTQQEKIENLIDQIITRRIDITQGVQNWFKLGCALANEFGKSGRAYFQDISQFHADYNTRQADREFDRCLAKQVKGGVTIGSFYERCKEFGVLVDYGVLKERHKGAFEGRQEKGNGQSEPLIVEEERPPAPLSPRGESQPASSEIVVLDMDGKPPFPIITTKPIESFDDYSLEEKPVPKNLRIEERKYLWESRTAKGESIVREISNFIFVPLYLLKHTSNPKRLFEIINTDDARATICLTSKALSNKSELTAEIEGRGNFVVDWGGKEWAAIKRAIYHEVKESDEISVLGYQKEQQVYAFANGVFDGKAFYEINEFGIAEAGKYILYLPPLSSVNKDAKGAFNNEKKFLYKPTPTLFSVWAEKIVQVYGDNGKIGLCYLIAALFRDLIFAQIDCFPILFLFGPPRTGKSTFRESLLSLFGEPQTAISLGSSSSAKGFARKLAQFCNALICFEEYKNSIKPALIEMLKSMYDGIGYERAQMTNDNRTHSTPVDSACVVAGQEMPTKESALFSRSILLTFSQVQWDDPGQYDQLKQMETQGLGNVMLEILQHRGQVAGRFKSAYRTVYEDLKKDNSLHQVSDRNIKNVAAILAPFKIIAGALTVPFTYETVLELAIDLLNNQNEIMLKTSEVSEFWQMFEYLVNDKWITRGEDYVIKDGSICIRFSRIFPKYKEQALKQGLHTLDKQTLIQYLKQQSYFQPGQIGGKDQKKVRFDGKSYWAYCFDYDQVKMNFEKVEI